MKEHCPFFSIIITCKNEDRFLKRTVMSVLSQSFDDYEIVIADGCSTDNTSIILNELSTDEHIIVCSDRDNGIYSGMNRGIRNSKGKYLHFLNVRDVFADKDILSKVHDYLISYNEPSILIGDYIWNTLFNYSHVKIVLDDAFYRNLRYSWGACHQAVFAKRDVLNEGFDEHYNYKADYAWFCDQYKKGVTISKIDIEIVVFDSYGTSNQLSHRLVGDLERKQITHSHFEDAAIIWREKHKNTDMYKLQLLNNADKKKVCILNILFLFRQNHVDLGMLIREMGYGTIAIYGMKEIGNRLYDELFYSDVEVKYVMDRRNEIENEYLEYISENEYKDVLDSVQAVVVTPLLSFIEIRDKIRNIGCQMCDIVPIESFIGDALWILYDQNCHFFKDVHL